MTAGGGNPLTFIAGAIGFTGNKFSGLNVKRVYFGNWLYFPPSNMTLFPLPLSPFSFSSSFPFPPPPPFAGGITSYSRSWTNSYSRDYSQAVDVGTLGRGIKLGTIRVLVWVMGFMANGYATEEFEVILLIPSPFIPIPLSLSLSFTLSHSPLPLRHRTVPGRTVRGRETVDTDPMMFKPDLISLRHANDLPRQRHPEDPIISILYYFRWFMGGN